MPKKKEDEKRPSFNTKELGSYGLKIQGGFVDEEWNQRLKGTKGAKYYQEMSDNNSAIGATLYAMESLFRGVEWRVEPAAETPEAQEWAQFLEECIIDMSGVCFEDFVSEVLSMLVYGWSYFEILYKIRKGQTKDETTNSKFDDGKIGWREFAFRAQDTLDTWETDERNRVTGMVQLDQYSGISATIPLDKALHFRTKSNKSNPEGRSLLRNAVVDYDYYKKICKIEGIGIERDMCGVPVMQIPIKFLHDSATAAEKALVATLKDMVSSIKRDEREGIIVPSETDDEGKPTGFKFSLLSTGGQRQINTDLAKKHYKVGMLQSMLAQFVELGMNGVGSLALASTQTDFFAVAIGSILDGMAAVLNKQGVERLMSLNGAPVELWPSIVHGDIDERSLAEIGQFVTSLATSGMLPPDDAIQRKLLEIAGLPVPSATKEDTEDDMPGIQEGPEDTEPEPDIAPETETKSRSRGVFKRRFTK